MMKINKKGIFFTFAAIALSLIIIFSFKVYTDYGLKDEMEVIEIRITTMNDFVKDLENDMENAIFISGFRGLLSLEDYMADNGEFFGEGNAPVLDIAFEDVFLYGTIPRGAATDHMDLMDNNTFLNWTERMKVEANKTSIELEFTVNDVVLSQSSPWIVDITVDLTIKVEDEKGTASWFITRDYIGQINITTDATVPISQKKFVDPLYLIYTNGLANNTIRETTEAFPGGSLSTHLINSYYRAHADAPSYLNRFQEDKKFTADPNGIESLADVETISGLGLGWPSGKTAVDYIYFDLTNNPSHDVIEGMEAYPWFELDYTIPCIPTTLHMAYYEATCDI